MAPVSSLAVRIGLRPRLAIQSGPVLIACGLGLMAAGNLLSSTQGTDVFRRVTLLYVLVPVLLGLKGNMELTLASRLTSAWHLGLLDTPRERLRVAIGNLAIVETQAICIGALAAVLTLIVAMFFGRQPTGQDARLLVAASLVTAAIAALVLSIIATTIVLFAGRFGLNPDNVSGPLVASLGDLVTLGLLITCVHAIDGTTDTVRLGLIGLICVVAITGFMVAGIHSTTKRARMEGWTAILFAMLIGGIAGLILERVAPVVPLILAIVPIINGLGGNAAAIHGSRVCSSLHEGGERPLGVRRTLLLVTLIAHLVVLSLLLLWRKNDMQSNIQVLLATPLILIAQLGIVLRITEPIADRAWRSGRDPDNSVHPYVTSSADLLGTFFLAILLWVLGSP